KQLMLERMIGRRIQYARHELPGARGWKCIRVTVEDTQQFRPKTEKRNHLRPNPGLDSPLRPLLRIYLEFGVHESVPQRSGHSRSDCPVGIAVSSSDNGPPFGQAVLPEFAIKHERITAR